MDKPNLLEASEGASQMEMLGTRVPKRDYDDICRIALRRGTTTSALVREMIVLFLEHRRALHRATGVRR